MPQSRLSSAVDDGALAIPDGDIAVLRPPAGYDLSALDRGAVRISHTFRPDADAWAAAGFPVAAAPAPARAALVVVPRAKALARAQIAAACAVAPLVIVDGQRTDGVDALWNDVRARLGEVPCVTRAHGRLFWFPASDAFADWAMPGPQRGADGFFTQPGVFSEGEADPGSALLAAALPAVLPRRMADLGAGWGYLSRAVLAREGVASLDLVEAEALALDCARLNVTDPRAAFHWADATRWRPERPLDGVVMNPPFHQGRAADPGLGRAFIAAAARMLGRDGALWMVANRHLPYETALHAAFRNVTPIGEARGFKLFHATRPVQDRPR